jgi:hypothetical protein
MELFHLKAVDTIFSMVPHLKSFTGERRREYFERLLAPLYESFADVHDFYCTLFLDTRDRTIRETSALSGPLSSETDSLELRRRLGDVKESFFRNRQTDEHLRDTLRQEAQAILHQISWPEERRFLVLVCCYFLQRGGVAPSDEWLDKEAAEVVEQGGLRYWDTPSMRTYIRLRESVTKDQILAILDEARHDLNQRYMNVRLAYRRVESAIVLKH